MSIIIETSIGDAVDRLTILNIKKNKINDENKIFEINKEQKLLLTKLQSYLKGPIYYYYIILEKINIHIWELLDNAKYNNNNNKEYELNFYRDQEDYNERRFRVKRMIDNYCSSDIKEQKGYLNKTCAILTNLGLGDHIYHGGMIRYLATKYDKIMLICLKSNLENLKLLFFDILYIFVFIEVEHYSNANHYKEITLIKNKLVNDKSIDKYFTGSYRLDKQDNVYDYPFSWYDIYNFDYSIFWEYNFIPKTDNCLYIYNLTNNVDYVFIHNTCSGGKVFNIDFIEENLNIDKNEILFINPCVNIYKSDHKFFELANKFLIYKVCEYSTLIENAKYVILSDSSFFGLAWHLKIKTNNLYYFNRGFDYEHFYNNKYKNKNPKQQRFIKLNTNNINVFPGPYKSHIVGGSEELKKII